MKVLQDSKALRTALSDFRKNNKRIGFVPTMGYLHEGHLSIMRQAKKENRVVVVSIFVNPLQFGPKEDFWRYPRNLVRDKSLLEKEKIDFLFVPALKQFYGPDFQTAVSVKALSQPLCGVTRPTHFAGVCTVVLKLLNNVMPDTLYLGQKDYQQFRVIEQLVKDLDFPVKVRMAPIVREKDGLAMSSRNVLLSAVEREEATFLCRALQKAEVFVRAGSRDAAKIKKAMRDELKFIRHGREDYLEIVDASTLESVVKLKSGAKILAALAVFFGKTRLIDNTLMTVE